MFVLIGWNGNPSVWMLLLFLMQVFADNFEIARCSFDTLKVGDTCISSAGNDGSWTSVKVSFPGSVRYDLREYEPRKLEVVDLTQYLGDPQEMQFRVDFETKYWGLIPDAWGMIAVLVVSGIAMLAIPVKGLQ